MRPLFAMLSLLFALTGCAAPSPWRPPGPLPPGCALTQRVAVKLTNFRNFMLAPAALDGQPAAMVLDTGAETSTVTPEAAARLGLPEQTGQTRLMRGVSGDVRAAPVLVRQFSLEGQVILADRTFGVGAMSPFPGVSPPVSGLMGADVLVGNEVEIDMGARRLALYAASGCAGYTPWPDAVSVPFARTRGGLMLIDAQLNGRRVRALVDTGARTTLVRRATALTIGVPLASLESDSAATGIGFGLNQFALRQHRFAELGVPGDTEADFTANVGDLRLPGIEMLLGADFLSARRVWISYATGRLFLRRS